MRRVLAIVPVVLLLTALAACGGDDDGPEVTDDTGTTQTTEAAADAISEDALVEYHFGDSSVPPEYHRSYTLRISKAEVHAIVDSYGDVLHEITEPLPAEVWAELRDSAGAVLDLQIDEDEEPCAGGTSRRLEIEDGGQIVVDVSFAACGGSNEQAESAVDSWVQPVLDAIPDWERYLDTE